MTVSSTSGGTPANGAPLGKNHGIAILANDKILDWVLPFLESYKATSAETPLYIIPYNENFARTKEIADLYGVHCADVDCEALDALSKRLYPISFGKRFRMRKLLSLALPLDEVVYIDVDIVLFRDIGRMFGKLEPGKTDFIVVAQSEDDEWVYNKHAEKYDFLREAVHFSDGFFVTSNKILSVADFYDVMARDEALFREVRQRAGLYTQPLSNFVTHRKRLKIVPIDKVVSGASNESYHKAEGVTFDADGLPLDNLGREIYFAHWAGLVGLPGKRVFDAAWKDFSRKAGERVKAAGL